MVAGGSAVVGGEGRSGGGAGGEGREGGGAGGPAMTEGGAGGPTTTAMMLSSSSSSSSATTASGLKGVGGRGWESLWLKFGLGAQGLRY